MVSKVLDVAIVGSGIAGLVASRQIKFDLPGKDVTIYEAAEYVGGRTPYREGVTNKVNPGGEFIGKRHDDILRLASQLGVTVEKFETKGGGLPVTVFDHPTLGTTTFYESEVEEEIDEMMPDSSSEYDEEETVKEWFDEPLSDKAWAYITAVCQGELDGSPEDVAFYEFVAYWEDPDETEKYVFTMGTGAFIKALAKEEEIKLQHTLKQVDECEQGYQLLFDTQDGEVTVVARTLVLTLPLAALGKIVFTTPLKKQRQELIAEGQAEYAPIRKIMTKDLPAGPTDYQLAAHGADMEDAVWIYDRKGITTQYGSNLGPEQSGAHIRPISEVDLAEGNSFFEPLLGATASSGIVADWKISYAGGAYFIGDDSFWDKYPKAFKIADKRHSTMVFCGEMYSDRHGGYMQGAAETAIDAAKHIVRVLKS